MSGMYNMCLTVQNVTKIAKGIDTIDNALHFTLKYLFIFAFISISSSVTQSFLCLMSQ